VSVAIVPGWPIIKVGHSDFCMSFGEAVGEVTGEVADTAIEIIVEFIKFNLATAQACLDVSQ
jgi:hypothetical protein